MAAKTYTGIADAHGLESLFEKGTPQVNQIILRIRAMANRHRHAVLYEADLTEKIAQVIDQQILQGDATGALEFLKHTAQEIRVEKGFVRSWNMIPNHDLDPFYEGGDSDEEI